MTPWPAWLRLGLLLPVLGLNAFVLKRLLVQFAPFPGLFLTAALIAFLLDLPCRGSRNGVFPAPGPSSPWF